MIRPLPLPGACRPGRGDAAFRRRRHPSRRKRAAIFLAGALCWQILTFPLLALADGPDQPAQAIQEVSATPPPQTGANLLVVPIPVINPTVGNGAVLVGALFYQPVKRDRQWVSGVGVLYTSNKDWALALAQQADLFDGRMRLAAFTGYGSFNLNFFGIGQSAGLDGRSIRLNEKGGVAIANALYRVAGNFYLGARYRFLLVNTSLAEPLFPNHPLLPDAQFKTQISGLGPSFEYDTRNNEFTPRHGIYINGQWLFDGGGLGSDFNYNKVTVAGNYYTSLDAKTVLALHASLCNSSNDAPFYDLCFFGSQHDLRGYEAGQYRDHSMFAVQGELRRALFWRFGVVGFAGLGAVAPSISELGQADPLPSVGVGLRFQPSKHIPVNVSVDYAWGKKSSGLYLYMGEAF